MLNSMTPSEIIPTSKNEKQMRKTRSNDHKKWNTGLQL